MSYSAKIDIKDIMVTFGLASGLFMAVGVNPEAEILKGFIEFINFYIPVSGLSFLFLLLPSILFIIALKGMCLAYLSGYLFVGV